MKTREQIATDLYNFGRDSVMRGGDSLRTLATHIPAMVYGVKGNDGPLWKDRAFNDKTIHLDRFEDYLLKPARDGLGIPSLLWLSRVLDAHEDKDEREKAFAALRQEIEGFDARVEKERARELVKRPEAAKERAEAGKLGGRGNKAVDNINSFAKPKRKGGTDPEYWIARLKRDAATDPKAEALLGSIEAGDIKPYRAAVDMGWVKPADPARIVEKQREKMTTAEQVEMWEQWGRALPDYAIDRVKVAQEAFLNLYDAEQQRFMTWARKAMKGAA